VLRRRPVGVAHAHVDDVLAAAARGHLELGGDVEDVGGQALDAVMSTPAACRTYNILLGEGRKVAAALMP
jgi:hypothetical protein